VFAFIKFVLYIMGPVDTGVMVGVLVDLGPLSPALLPDNHALVIRTGRQDVPEPTKECYFENIKQP
jgi:hypothetical protein